MTHTYIDSATTTDFQFTHAVSLAIEHSDFEPRSLFRSLVHAEYLDSRTTSLEVSEFLSFVEEYLCCHAPEKFSHVTDTAVGFWIYVGKIMSGEDVARCECFQEEWMVAE